jgi:broad specificity phosphatase PhoE
MNSYTSDQQHRIRGSSEIPLTEEGLQKTHELGQQLARKGGFDQIMSSSLGRTVQTAQILSKYTHAPITHVGDELHPWHLGELEGQPVDKVIDFQNDLIKNHPEFKIPGRGPLSTRDGESFDDFRMRAMPFIDQQFREHIADPSKRIALITHYRDKKLVDAWIRRGAEPSFEVDPNEMTTYSSDPPGSIDRLHWDRNLGAQVSPVDVKSPTLLQGGVYLIRHGQTAWNESLQNEPTKGGQSGS